jgi:hypothetical protein
MTMVGEKGFCGPSVKRISNSLGFGGQVVFLHRSRDESMLRVYPLRAPLVEARTENLQPKSWSFNPYSTAYCEEIRGSYSTSQSLSFLICK